MIGHRAVPSKVQRGKCAKCGRDTARGINRLIHAQDAVVTDNLSQRADTVATDNTEERSS